MGGILAFDSVCKIFEALVIRICVFCGSSSISDINLFHTLQYGQLGVYSYKELLNSTAHLVSIKFSHLLVSENRCCEAVLFCRSKPNFAAALGE